MVCLFLPQLLTFISDIFSFSFCVCDFSRQYTLKIILKGFTFRIMCQVVVFGLWRERDELGDPGRAAGTNYASLMGCQECVLSV